MRETRHIVGVGETILDILFRNMQPTAAVHGGSTFNAIISVGRSHVPCSFVSYTGNDAVGQATLRFMQDNGVGTDHVLLLPGHKSAISLAFLGENGDASYLFYKEPLPATPDWHLPSMQQDDILLIGSYFAVAPETRPLVTQMLDRAAAAQSIVYYDLNYRRNHQAQLAERMPAIEDNLRRSTIVRGSTDDLYIIYGTRDAREIYRQHTSGLCPLLICTAGAGLITVCTPSLCFDFEAPPITDVVSTVGAGDSFNAGFACALIWQRLHAADLLHLDRCGWQRLIDTACRFAGETCRSTENYIAHKQ